MASLLILFVLSMIGHANGDCIIFYGEEHNFTSWSGLNQMLNLTNTSTFATNSSWFNLHPSVPIILTSELDILQSASASKIGIENLQINMMGLGGLEVALWSSQADLS
jgi:hypothetical protein